MHGSTLSRAACLALPLIAWACSAPQRGDATQGLEPQRVVAEVNGRPILARDLEELWQAELFVDGEEPVARRSPDDQGRRARALDLAIRGELVVQAAEARGMQVDERQIAEQLRVMRSQFGSEQELQAYLQASGRNLDALHEQARRGLLMRAYVESVTPAIDVDEAEARRIYEAQRDRLAGPEQIRVAQILIRTRKDDSESRRAEARRRIEEAHRRAAAGEDFAALARQYSESPLAASGGDLGYFPRGRMIREFEDVVFDTPVGRITPVFETPHGWNVALVLDRRAGEVRSFEEVKTGLLMVLARRRRDEALRDHVDELRRKATVRILDPSLAGT